MKNRTKRIKISLGWAFHNLVGHSVMGALQVGSVGAELVGLVGVAYLLEVAAIKVHDKTIPEQHKPSVHYTPKTQKK